MIEFGYYYSGHCEPIVLCRRHEADDREYGGKYWVIQGWNLQTGEFISRMEAEVESEIVPITHAGQLKHAKFLATALLETHARAYQDVVPLRMFLKG